MRPAIACGASLFLASCFVGDEFNWATPDQIVEAAERCGVSNFEPTPAGDGWAAYVPNTIPDHAAKEDCIYDDLDGQGLLVTR